MKNICLCIVFVGLCSVLQAQSAEEKKVAERMEVLNNAILHPDKAVLGSLVADGLSYGHSSGKIQNKDEFVDDLVNGTFHFLTLSTTDQTISIAGDDAIVRHVMSFDFSNNGTNGHLKVGNLLVWKKTKGQWKLLARQAYKL